MKRHSFTTAELVEFLKGHGFIIKGATLNRYLAEGQVAKTKSVNRQGKNKANPLPIEEKEDTKNPTESTPKTVDTTY